MKVLIMVNRDFVLYNFRIELVERLLEEGHRVYISLPHGGLVEEMERMGCEYLNTPVDSRGTNPLRDLRLLLRYLRMCRRIKPDYVLTYTIKPNIYGAIAAKLNRIFCVINVSGLGTAVEFKGLLQKVTLGLYRIAAKCAGRVYFQNQENWDFFTRKKIALGKSSLLPGSGVNLERFSLLPYPAEVPAELSGMSSQAPVTVSAEASGISSRESVEVPPGAEAEKRIEFLLIGRVIKEKGIEEYIETARRIRKKYPGTKFHVLGPSDGGYERILREETRKGIICWHGMVRDVREYLKDSHCTIHPSYYPEGISNACLESAASGRPVITTDRSGCRETVADGVSGFIVGMRNVDSLVAAVERFIGLSWEEKRAMGLAGREKMEREFDRRRVVEEYMWGIKGTGSDWR